MLNKAPNIYSLSRLDPKNLDQALINNRWVAARPLGFYSICNRIKCAWLAFTGQCDLIRWPEDQ